MTICVAIKVQDCLVFAADSTSSLQASLPDGGAVTVNTYDNANKVFNLRKGLPIAAMTAGIGNFGNSSISTIAKDFRRLAETKDNPFEIEPDSYTMEEVATKARRYLFDERFCKIDEMPVGDFHFWVGGYSAGAEMGEIWRIDIHNGECPEPFCEAGVEQSSRVCWGGAPEAINRLVLGYGQGIEAALLRGGIPKENLGNALGEIAQFTQANLEHPAMPTADAIDLARFLAETTKQFVRFLPGANSVGGHIDIATVTKHENFKWVSRKHFYGSELNPLETNHV
jgi:hypothetical protein